MKDINKKVWGSVVVAILILLFITKLIIYPEYTKRIARKPHITGQIKLTIYGKPYVLSDKEARLTYSNDSSEQNIELINGNFKRNYGDYGETIFRLYISKNFCVQNTDRDFKDDLIIEFGYFTTPNWYKDNTSLNINIEKSKTDTNSDIIKITQDVSGDDNGRKEEVYDLKYPINNQQIFKVHQSFI